MVLGRTHDTNAGQCQKQGLPENRAIRSPGGLIDEWEAELQICVSFITPKDQDPGSSPLLRTLLLSREYLTSRNQSWLYRAFQQAEIELIGITRTAELLWALGLSVSSNPL